eukprot:8197654-Pyramimonas_sp.AAC.2
MNGWQSLREKAKFLAVQKRWFKYMLRVAMRAWKLFAEERAEAKAVEMAHQAERQLDRARKFFMK